MHEKVKVNFLKKFIQANTKKLNDKLYSRLSRLFHAIYSRLSDYLLQFIFNEFFLKFPAILLTVLRDRLSHFFRILITQTKLLLKQPHDKRTDEWHDHTQPGFFILPMVLKSLFVKCIFFKRKFYFVSTL